MSRMPPVEDFPIPLDIRRAIGGHREPRPVVFKCQPDADPAIYDQDFYLDAEECFEAAEWLQRAGEWLIEETEKRNTKL